MNLIGWLGSAIGRRKPVKWSWMDRRNDKTWTLITENPNWVIKGDLDKCPRVGDIVWGLTGLGRVWYMKVEKVIRYKDWFVADLGKWYYDPDQYISSFPGD